MAHNNILVLGANGQIAKHVISFLDKNNELQLSLFAKSFSNPSIDIHKHSIIQGNVLNDEQLTNAIKGQDIIYANLSGNVEEMARRIVSSMDKQEVNRLIFVTSLGIYNEIPGKFGEWNNQMIGSALKSYRKAADIIEASSLDFTIVRPAWLTDHDEIDFETTQKEEPFKGTEVSRKSVGSYIADIILHPEKDSRASVGINKPGTDGEKPAFY